MVDDRVRVVVRTPSFGPGPHFWAWLDEHAVGVAFAIATAGIVGITLIAFHFMVEVTKMMPGPYIE